ncbi:MAG: ribosome-binding factor A, partial [Pseudomonadota bacterium]
VISTYLMQEQSGAHGDLVSLTQVVVSPDLRQVKAFVCVIGKDEVDEETLATLQSHAPEIQRLFNSKFRMKFCPKIQFYNDQSAQMMAKIDRIVKEDTPSE